MDGGETLIMGLTVFFVLLLTFGIVHLPNLAAAPLAAGIALFIAYLCLIGTL
jgi:hypothetical protein